MVDPPGGGPRQHDHRDACGNLAFATLTGDAGDCDGIATGTDLLRGLLGTAWPPPTFCGETHRLESGGFR